MAAEIPPERDWRGPGCDERCTTIKALVPGVFGRSELLMHDPVAHEAYGRATAGDAQHSGVVVTGRLAIDLGRLAVAVDGRSIWIAPNEMRLLCCLARRLDLLVHGDDLISRVWGSEYLVAGTMTARWHLLRVNVGRLRARLGPMASLLVTVPGFGYRLIAVPPDADVSAWQPGPQPHRRLLGERWSFEWDACRRCGRTDRRHNAKGYCTGCKSAAKRLGLNPYGAEQPTDHHESERAS